MAHLHSVYDADKHFKIDPITREIINESGKFVLSQNDHNSERFTFEIPKTVDGHDMSLCNVVQVHYLNIEAGKEGMTYEGVYEVDDLGISPDSDDVVICSWLISNNATQYVGSLNFVLYFACVADDGTVDYAWSTAIHKGISVGDTIHNSDAVVAESSDILEQWRAKLVTAGLGNETLFILSPENYGTTLPAPGTLGRVFFKKVTDGESSIGGETSDLEPLIFTGAVSATYDGTKAVTVKIPSGGGSGTGGTSGEDGGYYTPAVSQVDENTMKVAFTASKEDMEAVEDQNITLPSGKDGTNGKSAYAYAVEGGYTGTEAGFAAKLAQETYSKTEIDNIMGSYINDIDSLIGGDS